MKKILTSVALVALVVFSSSCSKSRAEKMAMAENVVVNCNPDVLQLVGDRIPAEITVTYPEGYFYPEATLDVTPVLVYEGGSLVGKTVTFQGEKVEANNKVVPKAGGVVKENFVFGYTEGVERSYLELRAVVHYGKHTVECPAIKVAEGVNTTANLVDLKGSYNIMEDGYQAVLHKSTEGQILYDINSSVVKKSQLRSQSILELQEALKEIAADERVTVTGTQIIAYASPDGGEKLNAELSDKRAGTAEKAWGKITKDGTKADEVQVKSIGQDWKGFQEAISASDIADKELILRVLSMYSDPAVRESEIRNMSKIYTEISKNVFPELRRARFVTNYDFKNFTDEELVELSNTAINVLGEPALLRVAGQSTDADRKVLLYNLAAEKFNSQKALYNLAALYIAKNEPANAERTLARLEDKNSAEVQNLLGVAAMLRSDYETASKLFAKAGNAAAAQNLAAIDIYNGNYAAAASKLKNTTGTNAALANILNGDLKAASAALTGDDALTNYLKAIVAARKGDVSAAKAALKLATDKCPKLAERAAKDIEFATVR